MTAPSILDLAKVALADRDRGTPGEWRAANGKGTAAVAASDCYVFLNVRTVEVDDCVKRWQEDAAIIAAARTREPLLAAEVIRQTEVVNAFVNETVRIEARLADAERERDEAQAEYAEMGGRWQATHDEAQATYDMYRCNIARLRTERDEARKERDEFKLRVMSVAQERVIQAAVEWRDAAPEEESVEGRAARITSGWHLRRAVDALAKEPGQ